jgi:subtilase family serine protease
MAKVTESNEGNNCRASATTMLVGRPNLVTTAVSDPPAAVLPGGGFPVTDTVVNQGGVMAGASTTRYYLSLVAGKPPQRKLLTGTRAVGSLGPGAPSTGTKMVTVPASTALATYYLLACADDLARVIETNDLNNCAMAATRVTVGRPDLVVTAVSNWPGNRAKGSSFGVTETVANQGPLGAGPSTTRYYLSLNDQRGIGDRLLMGSRAVPAIGPGSSFPAPGEVTVTIPLNIAEGTYFVLACADDLRRVTEVSETNNCLASATTVVVMP